MRQRLSAPACRMLGSTAEAEVNGRNGAVARYGGGIFAVLAVEVVAGRAAGARAVPNLRSLRTSSGVVNNMKTGLFLTHGTEG